MGPRALFVLYLKNMRLLSLKTSFSVDLITEANLAQRAVFAGETFLMIFDPAYSVPKKAMHEAFVVEF